jgi:hypothetical protein
MAVRNSVLQTLFFLIFCFVGKSEEKKPLGRPRHRWEEILQWILKRWDRKAWTELIWFMIWTRSRLV